MNGVPRPALFLGLAGVLPFCWGVLTMQFDALSNLVDLCEFRRRTECLKNKQTHITPFRTSPSIWLPIDTASW